MQNLDRFKFRVFEKDSGIFYPDQDSLYGYLSGKYPDSIVMQCTGLKDKNGKLIFDGDVVEIEDMRCKISWEDYGFFVSRNGIMLRYELSTCHDTMEILGNVYENPELLESI
jgi:hypothetical protein